MQKVIWKSVQVWSGTTAASSWGPPLVPRVSAILALLSLQLKDVSMVKAKGKTYGVVVTSVFPHWTEHREATTHPTAPGVKGLRGECL